MLCKTIIKLLYQAIISKCAKVIDLILISNQAFTVYPCKILKRLDQNCSRCNLKLLYVIPLYQNLKNLPPPSQKKYSTVKPSISRNAYIL